jgi:hypothetical protein
MKTANRIYECHGNLDDENYKLKILDKDGSEFTPPSSLFKFYALTDYNVNAVRNFSFWASDKWQLNDPFDCHHHLIDYENANARTQKLILAQSQNLAVSPKEIIEEYYLNFFQHFGIVSLTQQEMGKPLNKLMWAHYTSNKGFCIEFDTTLLLKEKLIGLFPINYVEKLERVTWGNDSDVIGFEPFLYLTNVKYKDWCYENEWRIIAFEKDKEIPISIKCETKHGRLFKYDSRAIKSVTLGPLFFNLIKGNNHFEAKSSEQELLLNFIIEYNIPTFWIANPEFTIYDRPIMDFESFPIKLDNLGLGRFRLDK